MVKWRLLGVLGALCVLTAAPAQAATECKPSVTAKGKTFISRTLGAYPSSLFAWRAAVKEKHGAEYQAWRRADKRKIDCKQIDIGGGKKRWVCTRTAVPCKLKLAGIKLPALGCKKDPVSSYGARKKTEKAAITQAEYGWRIDVRKKFGKEWASWDNARGADVDCFKKGSQIQCIALGTPCKSKN